MNIRLGNQPLFVCFGDEEGHPAFTLVNENDEECCFDAAAVIQEMIDDRRKLVGEDAIGHMLLLCEFADRIKRSAVAAIVQDTPQESLTPKYSNRRTIG